MAIMALIEGTTAVPRSVGKLIETIGDQIGLFLEPTHIRRKGQAEADVTVAAPRAKADIEVVQLQNKLALHKIQDRADERVRRLKAKRQKNLEAIAAQAALQLPAHVSDQPVDEDWVAQFLDHCQDVSNENMQSVWARLLAREVGKPGSFSLRTLALVRVMSRNDADMFTRFCSVLWETPDAACCVTSRTRKTLSRPRFWCWPAMRCPSANGRPWPAGCTASPIALP